MPTRRRYVLWVLLGALLPGFAGCAATPTDAPASDGRATNANSEAAAMVVLDAFMASFSASDAAAHVDTYHFPHHRLARGEMNGWETRSDALDAHIELFKRLPDTGWARSEWVHRKVVTATDTKVHVDTRFRRLRADGSVIGIYDSLYVLILRDGRWGVALRSSFL